MNMNITLGQVMPDGETDNQRELQVRMNLASPLN